MKISSEQSMTSCVAMQDEAGQSKRVVTMTGRFAPGENMMMSLVVHDDELAARNHEEIAQAVDAFVSELRRKASEYGLPV